MNNYAWAVVNVRVTPDNMYVNIDDVFQYRFQAEEYIKLHKGAFYNRDSVMHVAQVRDWRA